GWRGCRSPAACPWAWAWAPGRARAFCAGAWAWGDGGACGVFWPSGSRGLLVVAQVVAGRVQVHGRGRGLHPAEPVTRTRVADPHHGCPAICLPLRPPPRRWPGAAAAWSRSATGVVRGLVDAREPRQLPDPLRDTGRRAHGLVGAGVVGGVDRGDGQDRGRAL